LLCSVDELSHSSWVAHTAYRVMPMPSMPLSPDRDELLTKYSTPWNRTLEGSKASLPISQRIT
jgi:hypothetical protein